MADEDVWTRIAAKRAAIIKAGRDLCQQMEQEVKKKEA